MQHVTPYIGMEFQVVEDALRDISLPALFQGATSQIPGRETTSLTIKQARTTLPDPTWTAEANWTASCVIKGEPRRGTPGDGQINAGKPCPPDGGGEG